MQIICVHSRSLAFTHTKTTCFGQEITVITDGKSLNKHTKTTCFGVSPYVINKVTASDSERFAVT